MADLLAIVCDVYCDFVTFPFGVLGQVWYLIYRFLILAVFLTLSKCIASFQKVKVLNMRIDVLFISKT